jgi:hypothetical protein
VDVLKREFAEHKTHTGELLGTLQTNMVKMMEWGWGGPAAAAACVPTAPTTQRVSQQQHHTDDEEADVLPRHAAFVPAPNPPPASLLSNRFHVGAVERGVVEQEEEEELEAEAADGCWELLDEVSFLGDAKGSLGDAESSRGDAESSRGDALSSRGDAKSSLGDARGVTLRARWVTLRRRRFRRSPGYSPPRCPRHSAGTTFDEQGLNQVDFLEGGSFVQRTALVLLILRRRGGRQPFSAAARRASRCRRFPACRICWRPHCREGISRRRRRRRRRRRSGRSARP